MNRRHLLVSLFLWALAGTTRLPANETPCVFCEIAAGTREADAVVYRDDKVVAFMNIAPRNPGHVLVIPVAHAPDFLAVPPDTMCAMLDVARRIVRALQRTDIPCEGFRLEMANGKVAGQGVFHAHLHIIPRYAGEPPEKTPHDRASPEELAKVAAKIRAALAQADSPPGQGTVSPPGK